jgi:hypothetical protein
MSTPLDLAPEESRIKALAERILAELELEALDLSVTLPAKRYVTVGQAVHDCEQVAVVAIRLMTGRVDTATGMGLPGAQDCQPAWSVVFSLELVRCAPTLASSRDGVVAGPLLSAAMDMPSGDSAVIRGAVQRLTSSSNLYNFGNVSCTINFPAPSGEMNVTVGTLTIGLP